MIINKNINFYCYFIYPNTQKYTWLPRKCLQENLTLCLTFCQLFLTVEYKYSLSKERSHKRNEYNLLSGQDNIQAKNRRITKNDSWKIFKW